jgi:hypothetical protein
MRLTFFVFLFIAVCMTNVAFGAATVFFKDGSKEVGNSVWMEGNTIYLSKSKDVFEFTSDEVLLEETQKFNRIGKFADMATSDSKGGHALGVGSNSLVEQLMKGANLDRQIDLFVQQVESGAMSSAGTNSELGDIFGQALAGFDSRKAKQRFRAYYRSHLDAKTLEAIVVWTKSPLGVKVGEAQINTAVTSPEMAQQILKDLDGNPPPARRWALIRDLDNAGRTTEMTQQLIYDAVAGASSAIPAGAADKKKFRRQFEKQMKEKKAEIAPLLRKQVQAGLVNTYKDLSDSELREYIVFLRTEPARKFTKVTMGALGEMTRTLSASMMKNIVKAADLKMGSQGR